MLDLFDALPIDRAQDAVYERVKFRRRVVKQIQRIPHGFCEVNRHARVLLTQGGFHVELSLELMAGATFRSRTAALYLAGFPKRCFEQAGGVTLAKFCRRDNSHRYDFAHYIRLAIVLEFLKGGVQNFVHLSNCFGSERPSRAHWHSGCFLVVQSDATR
jgi:hypothetical protein